MGQDKGSGDEINPLEEILKALGMDPSAAGSSIPTGFQTNEINQQLRNLGVGDDPQALQGMIRSFQSMMAQTSDAPVNWSMAADLARQVVAQGSDPTVNATEARLIAEAFRTADLWLDRATDLPATGKRTHSWSRAEWVAGTMPVWEGVINPIAEQVTKAMSKALTDQLPEEHRMMAAGMLPIMKQMGGAFFAMQIGHALGTLAGEVVGAGEVCLPLTEPGEAALVPLNVATFGEGLGIPIDEVRLYLALRETAFTRLVAASPWLRAHLLALVEEYARGISVDMSRIEEAVGQMNPMDPSNMEVQLDLDLFAGERSAAQQSALDRLELALALVEGWVDNVAHTAASGTLPHADQLRESVRRRRASMGPAEQAFKALVGLELRPRKLREAARLWSTLTELRGIPERDALWAHPDVLPGDDALADPLGFANGEQTRNAADDFDMALRELLESEQSGAENADGPESAPASEAPHDPDEDTK